MTGNNLIKNVVLVSDNAVDIQKIERQFMDTGSMSCQMVHYSTIEDALKHLNNKGLPVDVFILDTRLKGTVMPLETYKKMAAAISNIPIIALTGDSTGESAIGTLIVKAGAAGQTNRGLFDQLNSVIKSALYNQ